MSFCEGERTGSWSKPRSRMVSIAGARDDVEVIVVTGLRRRVRIVAPANGSLDFDFGSEGGRDGDGG